MGRNGLVLTTSFLILIFAIGCSSADQVFVARTDVPEEPTLAIIPANNSLYQHHFANKVEEKVIEAGLTVIQRPGVRTKEVTKEAGLAEMTGGDQAAQKTAEITQSYSGFGESEADYVIQTFALSEEVRVVELASGRVLASFDLIKDLSGPQQTTEKSENPLRRSLREIGLPVIENEEE